MRFPTCALLASLAAASLLLLLSGAPSASSELPSTGKADADLAPFDRLMTDFLTKQRLPGGALAVARQGKIVYARGFGYADLARKQSVEPDALFRIASISKPITAVAVLQLVERGKLKLDDRVFDVLHLAVPEAKGVAFDVRWKNVTILQLLQHTGGWDRDRSFDPMFRSTEIVAEMKATAPAQPDAVIGYMLRRSLDFEPGARYAYSNFGYCLLGRVVEKVGGQRYEEYVQQEVLRPLGIRRMRLGKTLAPDRAPGEVVYHDSGEGPFVLGPRLREPAPAPYGSFCLEAMDAHGGWIASAEDLVRFATAFDDPAKCKILGRRSIATMFARPEGKSDDPVYYGCGWQVRELGEGRINTWHTGSLPGTSTLLVRRADQLAWAVLFNSRQGEKDAVPASTIDPLVHQAADAVRRWPGERRAVP